MIQVYLVRGRSQVSAFLRYCSYNSYIQPEFRTTDLGTVREPLLVLNFYIRSISPEPKFPEFRFESKNYMLGVHFWVSHLRFILQCQINSVFWNVILWELQTSNSGDWGLACRSKAKQWLDGSKIRNYTAGLYFRSSLELHLASGWTRKSDNMLASKEVMAVHGGWLKTRRHWETKRVNEGAQGFEGPSSLGSEYLLNQNFKSVRFSYKFC